MVLLMCRLGFKGHPWDTRTGFDPSSESLEGFLYEGATFAIGKFVVAVEDISENRRLSGN